MKGSYIECYVYIIKAHTTQKRTFFILRYRFLNDFFFFLIHESTEIKLVKNQKAPSLTGEKKLNDRMVRVCCAKKANL